MICQQQAQTLWVSGTASNSRLCHTARSCVFLLQARAVKPDRLLSRVWESPFCSHFVHLRGGVLQAMRQAGAWRACDVLDALHDRLVCAADHLVRSAQLTNFESNRGESLYISLSALQHWGTTNCTALCSKRYTTTRSM